MSDNPFTTGWIPDEFDPRDRPLYLAASTDGPRTFSSQNQSLAASVKASASTPASTDGPRTFSSQNQSLSASLKASAPISSAGTGKIVSLRAKCPPIYDQGQLNSCTANAVAAALRYAIAKTYGVSYDKCDPSRLFIYLNGRRWGAEYGKLIDDKDKNTPKDPVYQVEADNGAYLRKTIDGIRMAGACDEKRWPYPGSDPTKGWTADQLYKAPNSAWDNALTYIPRVINFYRIVPPEAWHRVIDPQSSETQRLISKAMEPPPIADLQKCIDDGYPFIFGIYFFISANLGVVGHIDADGVFTLPPTTEQEIKSAHAVLAIGYDAGKGRFLIQNSWGTADWPFPSWSDIKPKDEKMRGYCWVPYEWFLPGAWKYSTGPRTGKTATFTSDFWVIKVPEGAPVDLAGPRIRAGGEPWLPKSSKP